MSDRKDGAVGKLVTVETIRRAQRVSAPYFVHGMDPDDLTQEALIGALEARRDWNGHGDFGQFEWYCMRRQVQEIVGRSLAKKRGSGERTINLPEGASNPHSTEHLAETRAELRAILDRIAGMTLNERRAISGTALGYSYAEIGGPYKQTDNALQRARRKLAA